MTDYIMPERKQNSNKGTFGKVLNFSGSKNYMGAAYLSSVSVLKIGAGYLALATEKNIINTVATMLPEAVYLSRKEGLERIKDFSVIMVGCGLGITIEAKRIFKKIIKKAIDKPIVIDADGLNILAKCKNLYLNENCVITPHPKEAANLLGVDLQDVLNDLEGSAKKLTDKYNCVTVLKTHRTIICDKNNYFINQYGNSALAKAGSGDVLAGVIAGLVAQKMPIFDAAKLGVYLHSKAGEYASEDLSEYSVLASDLPKYLHKAILEIEFAKK